MIRKLFTEIANIKRDRYFYEKILRNQLEIGFQNVLLGASKKFPARLKGFSQGEEDFYLYALSRILDLTSFLEFGVEDWRESNTRILSSLINGKYCLIDGDQKNIARIKQSHEYYTSNIEAIEGWITVDNINSFISAGTARLSTEFDVISIDVDGNDYWILSEISVRPKLFIVEYNSLFGDEERITIPYEPGFSRFKHDASGCIYGASFQAIQSLMDHRGYSLFHVSEMGNNMIFLQHEYVGQVSEVICGNTNFREISYREMHENGQRIFSNFSVASEYVLNRNEKYINLDKSKK